VNAARVRANPREVADSEIAMLVLDKMDEKARTPGARRSPEVDTSRNAGVADADRATTEPGR